MNNDTRVTTPFFHDRLSIKLAEVGLLHQSKMNATAFYREISVHNAIRKDSRKMVLTVMYKLNTVFGKYKGKGAGQGEKVIL